MTVLAGVPLDAGERLISLALSRASGPLLKAIDWLLSIIPNWEIFASGGSPGRDGRWLALTTHRLLVLEPDQTWIDRAHMIESHPLRSVALTGERLGFGTCALEIRFPNGEYRWFHFRPRWRKEALAIRDALRDKSIPLSAEADPRIVRPDKGSSHS